MNYIIEMIFDYRDKPGVRNGAYLVADKTPQEIYEEFSKKYPHSIIKELRPWKTEEHIQHAYCKCGGQVLRFVIEDYPIEIFYVCQGCGETIRNSEQLLSPSPVQRTKEAVEEQRRILQEEPWLVIKS